MTLRVTARDAARQIFDAALQAIATRELMRHVIVPGSVRTPVELLAVGKAAVAMAEGVLATLPVARGLVVTKSGHARTLPDIIEVREAAHPVPDDRSLAAGLELLARAAACPVDRTLLVAVSGGASALAVAPLGVTFVDKVAAVRAVAAAGRDIRTINAVRKHLSALKGGRLAAASRAPVLSLVLSDVIGPNDVAAVGGGPAVLDDTTLADARAGVADLSGVPDSVRAALADPGQETPRHLSHVNLVRVAGPEHLLAAAAAAARRMGLVVDVCEGDVGCTVDELAARLSEAGSRLAPGHVALFGGEPTIRLPDRVGQDMSIPGRGGRAQHTALLWARAMRGLGARVALLAAGSDGSDGPTADAGAIVDGDSWSRIDLDGDDALARFASGAALARSDDLLTTGPTDTNLCDLYVVAAGTA